MKEMSESCDEALNESSTRLQGTLYIKTVGQRLAPQSWSVVFLHQFCTCNCYNIVKVDTHRKHTDSTNRLATLQLPSDTLSCLVKWSELPDVVKNCELPVLVESSGLVCYSGICTVLRRLVMDTDAQDPASNLIALLVGTNNWNFYSDLAIYCNLLTLFIFSLDVSLNYDIQLSSC